MNGTNTTPDLAKLVANAKDIRDIKPPLEIPNPWLYLLYALCVLALVALAWFAWRWWQKRRAERHVTPPLPAHVRARYKLEEALALILQPKPFCILVSDTVRQYLEEQFDFRAPERTTEEFLHELGGTEILTSEQKGSLGEFLEQCDLVKFAKYEPGEPELRQLHGSALRLVEETKPVEIQSPESKVQSPQAA
jgi:hypothetical protein